MGSRRNPQKGGGRYAHGMGSSQASVGVWATCAWQFPRSLKTGVSKNGHCRLVLSTIDGAWLESITWSTCFVFLSIIHVLQINVFWQAIRKMSRRLN